MATKKQTNRILNSKRVNDFTVEFLRLEDNDGNILGRQVKSIDRPTLTFNTFETHHKKEMRTDTSKVVFSDAQIVFKDDEGNLVLNALYKQIYIQNGRAGPTFSHRSFEKAKFDVAVKTYNSHGEVVEKFTYKNCIITGITHTQGVYENTTSENEVTVTIKYDTIDFDGFSVS